MEFMDGLHALIGREDGDISAWQMSVRAAIIFLYGLVLVRLAGKRVFGKWGAIDIILSIIVGSNLSRALTASAPFVETLVATTVLVVLHAALVMVATRAPALGPLLKGKPVRIVRDGACDEAVLRRHGVGEGDLHEALRCAGVARLEDVREAWVERNGKISVLKA